MVVAGERGMRLAALDDRRRHRAAAAPPRRRAGRAGSPTPLAASTVSRSSAISASVSAAWRFGARRALPWPGCACARSVARTSRPPRRGPRAAWPRSECRDQRQAPGLGRARRSAALSVRASAAKCRSFWSGMPANASSARLLAQPARGAGGRSRIRCGLGRRAVALTASHAERGSPSGTASSAARALARIERHGGCDPAMIAAVDEGASGAGDLQERAEGGQLETPPDQLLDRRR